jgi:8-amino-3,8-dideoxy-alpha-D-manno-octulosonate transaminase
LPGFELIGAEEAREVASIFENGGVLFRHGFDALRNGTYKVRDFETAFARHMGAAHAVAVSSGTAALRVALAALDIRPGDEVITQSFTFVATVEAIIEAGAVPIVVEVDEGLNMAPDALEAAITDRTKAIIVVHMLGVPAKLDAILAVARRKQVPVMEDTAWGCSGSFGGRKLGTLGAIGTFSFDYAKTLTTGEGGMVVTDDPVLAAKAAAYQDHGHENNPAVPRWEDTRSSSGFNYRMSELQGAVGLAQLAKLDEVVAAQRANKAKLAQAIQGLPGVQIRPVPPEGEETADALVFYTPSPEAARACRRELLAEGLGTKILPEAISWHFAGTWDHMEELVAAHPAPLAEAFPRSRALLDRCVALPVMVKMADDVPARVARAIGAALEGGQKLPTP